MIIKTAFSKEDIKSKDMQLWHEWKRTRSPDTLQRLINQMNPIINREVNKWAAAMSRTLLESHGRQLAIEAFEKYDPNKGVALSTYVASRLPKLSRMVYANQNTARLSETKALLFHTYNTALNELKDRLGREPTHSELADHLGWTSKKLESFKRQSNRKEFVESEEHPDFAEDEEMDQTDFIYHDLTPLQQKIFEYSTGYKGSKMLSGAQIMKELNITQGQLSYQKSIIIRIIEQAQGKHGR